MKAENQNNNHCFLKQEIETSHTNSNIKSFENSLKDLSSTENKSSSATSPTSVQNQTKKHENMKLDLNHLK